MGDVSCNRRKVNDAKKQWYPGLPLIEIIGNKRVLIERHRGVLVYDANKIYIQVSGGKICICGSDLMLAKMSKEQLVVVGQIHSVNLSGR